MRLCKADGGLDSLTGVITDQGRSPHLEQLPLILSGTVFRTSMVNYSNPQIGRVRPSALHSNTYVQTADGSQYVICIVAHVVAAHSSTHTFSSMAKHMKTAQIVEVN